ncbi:MAG: polyprenyl synthetase family protein [Nocardioidaceae bacterium]
MSPPTAEAALQRVLDQGRARATATDPEHALLWDALAVAAVGGKRFRPALVSATHDALGGTCPGAAAEVGAAVELLHTAFVIHDDVIDCDDRRRGRLNVGGTFTARAASSGASLEGAESLGRTAGILAGDLALAAAVRAVATCGAPTAVVHRLLDHFDVALHTTAAGELADVGLAVRVSAASLPESLDMEEKKTSAYSFVLPLQAGAVLADADETTVRGLARVGSRLGIAFQLVDDLLGVFGDPVVTGKSATSDLRTRKQTPLLAHARTTAEWDRISQYVGRDLDDEELDDVRRLLTCSGSRQFVEELAEIHLVEARDAVAEMGLPPDLLASVSLPAVTPAGSDHVAA